MRSRSAFRSSAFSVDASMPNFWLTSGEQHRREGALKATEPAPAGLAANDHERPALGECSTEVGEAAVAAGVDDDVVALGAGGEVLDRVAADAGDLGSERLGDLHGEGADATGRADAPTRRRVGSGVVRSRLRHLAARALRAARPAHVRSAAPHLTSHALSFRRVRVMSPAAALGAVAR